MMPPFFMTPHFGVPSISILPALLISRFRPPPSRFPNWRYIVMSNSIGLVGGSTSGRVSRFLRCCSSFCFSRSLTSAALFKFLKVYRESKTSIAPSQPIQHKIQICEYIKYGGLRRHLFDRVAIHWSLFKSGRSPLTRIQIMDIELCLLFALFILHLVKSPSI